MRVPPQRSCLPNSVFTSHSIPFTLKHKWNSSFFLELRIWEDAQAAVSSNKTVGSAQKAPPTMRPAGSALSGAPQCQSASKAGALSPTECLSQWLVFCGHAKAGFLTCPPFLVFLCDWLQKSQSVFIFSASGYIRFYIYLLTLMLGTYQLHNYNSFDIWEVTPPLFKNSNISVLSFSIFCIAFRSSKYYT